MSKEQKNDIKHTFIRIRTGSKEHVIAKCEYCGLKREGTKGNYTYVTHARLSPWSGLPIGIRHVDVPPKCWRETKTEKG